MLGLAPLGGGIFLGWSLGANDAANVFGTAVAARIITFRKACLLCGVAVILGAYLQGQTGIKTLSALAEQNSTTLVIISLSATLTVTLMTFLRIPVSTSQAVVGAIAGLALATKGSHLAGGVLVKIVICWIATPIGAMIFAMIVYQLLRLFITYVPMSILSRDKILWSGLLVVGTYGSYALGANNVANATGIFSGQFAGITDSHLALIGGIAIAAGVITYSKRMMFAVGSGIMPLDAFTAFVAVCAMSITVHVFAVIGVPVSTSQGIVGAIIGIGIMQGSQAIQYLILRNIALGWLMTPIMALILAAAGFAILSGSVN